MGQPRPSSPPTETLPAGNAIQALAPSVVWATIGTVFNQGSTLVSNIAIANILGRDRFGEYALVLSTAQATTALAGLGVGYTATRYVAEWRHRDPVRAGRLLGMFSRLAWITAIAAMVLMGIGSTGLAGSVLRAPSLGPSLALAAGTALFMVRNSFLMGVLSGFESFRRIGIAGILSGSGYLLVTALGAWLYGVVGAAIGLLTSAVIQWTVLSTMVRLERRAAGLPTTAATFAEEKDILLRFAVPAALSGLTSVPVLWAIQALLARSEFGFGAVAVYAAGLNFLTVVLFVPTVVNGVAMPWINRRRTVGGVAGFRHALRANLAMTLGITMAMLGAMALAGQWLLGLYGQAFRSGLTTVLLLLAAAIPEALTVALNQSLQARERMWHALLGINTPRDIAMLIAALLLIPRFGAIGAAAAYLTGRVIALIAISVMVRHDLVELEARTR